MQPELVPMTVPLPRHNISIFRDLNFEEPRRIEATGGTGEGPLGSSITRSCSSCGQKDLVIANLVAELEQMRQKVSSLEDQLAKSHALALSCILQQTQKSESSGAISQDSDCPATQASCSAARLSNSAGYQTCSLPVPADAAGPNVTSPTPSATTEEAKVNSQELCRASDRGEVERVEELLEARADPNSCDRLGFTALHGVSKKGHRAVLDCLIRWKADVNRRADGWKGETPLHYACKYGHEAVVCSLVKARADQTLANQEGETALQYAQQKQRAHVERLLQHSAVATSDQPPGLESPSPSSFSFFQSPCFEGQASDLTG